MSYKLHSKSLFYPPFVNFKVPQQHTCTYYSDRMIGVWRSTHPFTFQSTQHKHPPQTLLHPDVVCTECESYLLLDTGNYGEKEEGKILATAAPRIEGTENVTEIFFRNEVS